MEEILYILLSFYNIQGCIVCLPWQNNKECAIIGCLLACLFLFSLFLSLAWKVFLHYILNCITQTTHTECYSITYIVALGFS